MTLKYNGLEKEFKRLNQRFRWEESRESRLVRQMSSARTELRNLERKENDIQRTEQKLQTKINEKQDNQEANHTEKHTDSHNEPDITHVHHTFPGHHFFHSLKDKFKAMTEGLFGSHFHHEHSNLHPHGILHFHLGNPFLHSEADSGLGEPTKFLDVPPEDHPVTKAEVRKRREAF